MQNNKERAEKLISKFGLTASVGDNRFINGIEYVDLGLPSGLLWARCNVGAEKETDFGEYMTFDEANAYKFNKGWRLPTIDEFKELINYTRLKCETINEVVGYKSNNIYGEDNKGIFFPLAGGGCSRSRIGIIGERGFYWSSNKNGNMFGYVFELWNTRFTVSCTGYCGKNNFLTVRGVFDGKLTNVTNLSLC